MRYVWGGVFIPLGSSSSIWLISVCWRSLPAPEVAYRLRNFRTSVWQGFGLATYVLPDKQTHLLMITAVNPRRTFDFLLSNRNTISMLVLQSSLVASYQFAGRNKQLKLGLIYLTSIETDLDRSSDGQGERIFPPGDILCCLSFVNFRNFLKWSAVLLWRNTTVSIIVDKEINTMLVSLKCNV